MFSNFFSHAIVSYVSYLAKKELTEIRTSMYTHGFVIHPLIGRFSLRSVHPSGGRVHQTHKSPLRKEACAQSGSVVSLLRKAYFPQSLLLKDMHPGTFPLLPFSADRLQFPQNFFQQGLAETYVLIVMEFIIEL